MGRNIKSVFVSLAFSCVLIGASSAEAGWVTGPDVPGYANGVANAPTTAIDGTVYVIGGNDNSGWFTNNASYNLATNTWTSLAPLPAIVADTTATAINGIIYVPGGNTNSPCCVPTDTLFMYNVSTDSWSGQSMPFTSEYGCSGAIRGQLFVTGPSDATGYPVNLFESYNPATNAWTPLPSPTIMHVGGACGVMANKFYLASGSTYLPYQPQQLTNVVEVYDPKSNSWTQVAPMPTPVRGAGFAVWGSKLYILGGCPDSGCVGRTNLVQVYDPGKDAWSTITSVPAGLASVGGAATQGVIFLEGGQDANTQVYSTNLMLVPPR